MTSRVVAAFDIGTNAVQMRVAARDTTGELRTLLDRNVITGLGRGVDRSGRLQLGGIERTCMALESCMQHVRPTGARVVAVGTSALRDATNAGEFTIKADAILGTPIRVISGDREAQLTARGALHDLPFDTCTLVDIGGGSTEFIEIRGRAVSRATSVNIGSVRLFERMLKHDPPTAEEVAALHRTIDDALIDVAPEGPLVALAGTATSIGLVAKERSFDEVSSLHLATLPSSEVRRVARELAAMSLKERQALTGLHPDRADVIVAGSAILSRVVDRAGADSVLLSDGGVRVGLLLEEFDREV